MGSSMMFSLASFLCSVKLTECFPLADVRSLLRPLSNCTPLVWAGNEGHGGSMYFKLNRTWLREVDFKEVIKKA